MTQNIRRAWIRLVSGATGGVSRGSRLAGKGSWLAPAAPVANENSVFSPLPHFTNLAAPRGVAGDQERVKEPSSDPPCASSTPHCIAGLLQTHQLHTYRNSSAAAWTVFGTIWEPRRRKTRSSVSARPEIPLPSPPDNSPPHLVANPCLKLLVDLIVNLRNAPQKYLKE